MEQERRSMKARQAMLESKLPRERERRRGGSKECTCKVVILFVRQKKSRFHLWTSKAWIEEVALLPEGSG